MRVRAWFVRSGETEPLGEIARRDLDYTDPVVWHTWLRRGCDYPRIMRKALWEKEKKGKKSNENRV